MLHKLPKNNKEDFQQKILVSDIRFFENIDLKAYNTYGIGGPARYFLEINTIEEMQKAIYFCHQSKLPYFILGKGSNCLFDDRGFKGAVLHNKIDFFEKKQPGVFHIGAGYSFALLGVQTARQGWGGLEFASGIPASVGGAIFMNAGANGGETSQFLTSVDYVTPEGQLEQLCRHSLVFDYRYSSFQRRQGAIVGGTFTLKPFNEARKQQIEIVNKRKCTQPLNAKSAGCVFLNPENKHAGALIEQCGLKGLKIGDAQVSEKHANFLINTGNATCIDMLNLIALVQKRVKEITGTELKSEVRHIIYEDED